MSWSSVILLAGSTIAIGLPLQAQSVIDRTRDRFPIYDPEFQSRQTEQAAVPASHANRPRLRSIPPPQPKPEAAIIEDHLETLETDPNSEVVKLPEMTVETQALPSVHLPRLVAPAP
tara:strand:- start:701 stop:1051 length:351 start_codon:yes stop_codon:yes gene_type:complete